MRRERARINRPIVGAPQALEVYAVNLLRLGRTDNRPWGA